MLHSIIFKHSVGNTVVDGKVTATVSNLAEGSTYYFAVTASNQAGLESSYSNEVSTTTAMCNPGLVSDAPFSEIAMEGTVTGGLMDVEVSDNSYQIITEEVFQFEDGTETSVLEHKWMFNVTGAEVVTFYVEAHHSYNEEGDDFIFAFSTDNINYIDMVTVTKTADDNTAQYYTLPSGLSGTVYVRVHDADGTSGHTQLDSIYIDELVIESEVSSTVPKLSTSVLTGINDDWQTFELLETYISPVIVATVVYGNTSDAPAVARVRNVDVANNSFELKVQNPSGANLSNYTVHIMVVEEGVYTVAEHGVDLEAIKVVSDGTNSKSNWGSSAMEQIEPSNTYSSPVVLGQVMTENNTDWSVFWSCDGSRKNPASGSSIYVGKHVGGDIDNTTRSTETLGVIILESGSGTLDGVNYTAGLGADSVLGMDDNPPFSYDLSGGLLNVSNESAALVSSAGMDGGDGGWAALFGSSPVSATNLYLVIDEDQIGGDSERRHTSEQVSYIVFE